MANRIKDQVGKVEEAKERLELLRNKIDSKNLEVQRIISQARQDTFALLSRHFDELEARVHNEISV